MKFWIVIIFSIIYLPLFSQIVNIEDQRAKDSEEGLSGQADFNFNINKNTSVLYQLGNRVQARYRKDSNIWLFFNELNIVKTSERSFLNGGFQHLRYNKVINKGFRLEAFTQSQYNGIQRIDWRYLLGGGGRFTLFNADSLSINLATLFMYEYEDGRGDLGVEHALRLSTYLSFKIDLTKNASISSTTYYQPKVWQFKDYRVSNESTFNIGISEKLSLKIIYTILFDAEPAPEVPQTIYSLRNAVSYRF